MTTAPPLGCSLCSYLISILQEGSGKSSPAFANAERAPVIRRRAPRFDLAANYAFLIINFMRMGFSAHIASAAATMLAIAAMISTEFQLPVTDLT